MRTGPRRARNCGDAAAHPGTQPGPPRAAQDAPRGAQSQLGPTWRQLGTNLGPLGTNLGPTWAYLGLTWAQLGPREAKSDCIFTVFCGHRAKLARNARRRRKISKIVTFWPPKPNPRIVWETQNRAQAAQIERKSALEVPPGPPKILK